MGSPYPAVSTFRVQQEKVCEMRVTERFCQILEVTPLNSGQNQFSHGERPSSGSGPSFHRPSVLAQGVCPNKRLLASSSDTMSK